MTKILIRIRYFVYDHILRYTLYDTVPTSYIKAKLKLGRLFVMTCSACVTNWATRSVKATDTYDYTLF